MSENVYRSNLLFPISGSKGDKTNKEAELMRTIAKDNFEEIERSVTPRKFQDCDSNSLETGMKVRARMPQFKLRITSIERFSVEHRKTKIIVTTLNNNNLFYTLLPMN